MGLKKDAAQKEATFVATVKRVKDFTKDGNISVTFDMEVNGIMIYGLWYREGTSKEGKGYEMISFPSHKGNDDKYYNYAYFKISKELQEDIVNQIQNML